MKYVHIFLLSSAILVSGCSSIQQPDPKPCEPYEIPKLEVPNPAPVEMAQISFVVVNKTNATQEFQKLEKAGVDPVVFGLTDENYKSLSMNIEKMQAYIMQQQDIIEAYRQYYESTFNGEVIK